jgi:hypothetical protein
MGMDVNSAETVGYYNTPVAGGQNLPPEKKKDGLPVGQIATSVGVGGFVGAVRHVGINGERELWNSLKHVNLDDPNGLTKAIESLPAQQKKLWEMFNQTREEQIKSLDSFSKEDLKNMSKNIKLLEIYRRSPEETREYIRALSKYDLDNTAKHLGKTFGWAALAAGVTAAGYGLIRALVHRNKEPNSTP